MTAIEFVVRDSAGGLQRGFVGGDGAAPAVMAAQGADISLNLARSQIVSYTQIGDALHVTLSDGRVIVIQHYFGADGQPISDLFISYDGLLAEVTLAPGMNGTFYANYVEQDVFGKWSPEDDLYFVHGDDGQVGQVLAPADDDGVGMLAAFPLLGGIALPLLGLIGLGVGTAVLGEDDDRDNPTGTILQGTKDVGHVVNAEDQADGVGISGTGTPGATVVVTIQGHQQTTVITPTGTWSVLFPPDQIDTGTYETPVVVTVSLDGKTITINDALVVDTEVGVTFDEDAVGGDGMVNAVEHDGVVTLTGTVEAGSTVTVVINTVTYTAIVTGATWSLALPAAALPAGVLTQSVSVTAVDAHDNTITIAGSFQIDTETAVTINTAIIGGNNHVNHAEHALGVPISGTAEAGASVVVTVGAVSHTVVASATGTWTVNFATSEIATGIYQASVTAVSTDAAGNTATSTGTFDVDTETVVTIETATVETDGVVNFVERADGVTLTGTAEAGAAVVVTMAGVSQTVTATAGGTWSANFAAAGIPSGETLAAVTAVSTDVAGNTASASGNVTIDTFVNTLTITSGVVGSDGIINAAEQGQPITLTGMVEIGSTVSVTLAGISLAATVAANGAWTVTYPAGSLPTGEFATQVVVNATDAAGNTASVSENVTIDTVAGDVTLSPLPIEIDDVVNFVERSDGVMIHGTATPGLTVTVSLGSATHQVVAAADGTWSSLFLSAEVPEGTYLAPISASITDAAGNFKEVTDAVQIDTEVVPFTLTTPVEGDNIVNAAEEADGVILSGTVEVGSTVNITFAGATRTVVAGADGAWSASFAASGIADGQYDTTITATATDLAGNTRDLTHQVRIDTVVEPLTLAAVEGDDLVNRAEAQDGITLTGTVEIGSTVMVTFEGVSRAATVAADGHWSVSYTGAEVPSGEYTANVSIHATDPVGNTRTLDDTFSVDTTPPDAPLIESYTRAGSGVIALAIDTTTDTVELHHVAGNGSVGSVDFNAVNNPFVAGQTVYDFSGDPIPNGSHLVMTASDTSGNATSTLFVLEETLTNNVNIGNPGLDAFNIEAIDLQFAEDSVLTLTASDLESLAAHSNVLTVHGGLDDTVNILGGAATGATQTIDGRTYDVYSLGTNGGTLIIDEAITVHT